MSWFASVYSVGRLHACLRSCSSQRVECPCRLPTQPVPGPLTPAPLAPASPAQEPAGSGIRTSCLPCSLRFQCSQGRGAVILGVCVLGGAGHPRSLPCLALASRHRWVEQLAELRGLMGPELHHKWTAASAGLSPVLPPRHLGYTPGRKHMTDPSGMFSARIS